MAVALYQRAEPRHKHWLPLLSQQIRLRNVTQIVLLNPKVTEGDIYFTLHVSPLSAPFFTSCKIPVGKVTQWEEIQVSHCSTRLSAKGCIIRIWTGQGQSLLSWGVYFQGLHYLGLRDEWDLTQFQTNTLIFSTPYGSFTSLRSLLVRPIEPQRFLLFRSSQDVTPRRSYVLKNLVALHRNQRYILEEHETSEKKRLEIGLYGYGIESPHSSKNNPLVSSERLIQKEKLGRKKLQLKKEIDAIKIKINCLKDEKARAEGRIQRVKLEAVRVEESTSCLVSFIENSFKDLVNLKEKKASLAQKGQLLSKYRSGVFLRKKQLISELLQIYPLDLVEGSKKYSINGVQLPNAEEYGSEGGGQISVALGYTAHLVAMLAFFLDIPCRYPIRHFGSRSRIIDHITVQIPDKEREFPLYFKGKKDVYCAYAVYLLNKNIAQLRWYCALSTPDLRASLPNLVELLNSRLVIPGWPPNLGEALEIAQEITEEVDPHFFADEMDVTRSLDQGLDKILATEEPYLKEAFSEDNPGGNSAALGEIQHGRGQERFLSGWKKKTYVETDDFDPKWLLDSMNLDFDTKRRFSMTSSSPPPKPSLISEDLNHSARRRRMGQVEPPPLSGLAGEFQNSNLGVANQSEQKADKNTPSKDIIQLEKDIKEFERRRSRGSIGITIPSNKEISEGVRDSNVSLTCSSNNLLAHPPPTVDNWVTDEEPSSDNGNGNVQDDLNGMMHVQHAEVCSSGYHIPPPVEKSPCKEEKPFSEISPKLEVSKKDDCTEVIKCDDNNIQSGPKESEVRNESVLSKDCDSGIKKCEVSSKDGNSEDCSLWMRTEALMDAPSFNLVRRRMSTSEST